MAAGNRDRLMARFMKKNKRSPEGDPFGAIGNLSPGTRIKRGRSGRITEDDPRWNPRTMGNRRGR